MERQALLTPSCLLIDRVMWKSQASKLLQRSRSSVVIYSPIQTAHKLSREILPFIIIHAHHIFVINRRGRHPPHPTPPPTKRGNEMKSGQKFLSQLVFSTAFVIPPGKLFLARIKIYLRKTRFRISTGKNREVDTEWARTK